MDGKKSSCIRSGAPRKDTRDRRAHRPAGLISASRSARAVTGSSAGSQAYS
jgi:hypothetical protein